MRTLPARYCGMRERLRGRSAALCLVFAAFFTAPALALDPKHFDEPAEPVLQLIAAMEVGQVSGFQAQLEQIVGAQKGALANLAGGFLAWLEGQSLKSARIVDQKKLGTVVVNYLVYVTRTDDVSTFVSINIYRWNEGWVLKNLLIDEDLETFRPGYFSIRP